MEISHTTDYAVRAVLHLAIHGPEGRVRAADIAAEQAIPPDYLPKVLRTLARAGIVAGSPGRSGGVRLLRSPERLTILQIVEAMEGPVILNRCLSRRGECPRDSFCPVHPIWRAAQTNLIRTLRDATVASLLPKTPKAPRTPKPKGRPVAAKRSSPRRP